MTKIKPEDCAVLEVCIECGNIAHLVERIYDTRFSPCQQVRLKNSILSKSGCHITSLVACKRYNEALDFLVKVSELMPDQFSAIHDVFHDAVDANRTLQSGVPAAS
jgi:hypothetical protein